jgi:hypothetical protein
MSKRFERMMDGMESQQQADLGDLSEVEALLSGYDAPQPAASDTDRLLLNLEPFLNADKHTSRQSGFRNWRRLARSQAGLLETPFWLASVFVFVLGLGLALLDGEGALALLFVFLSPAAAAAGVAYAFRPATRTLWELEKISPTHPLELLYTRLALIIGFNSLLALLMLGIAWWQGPQLVLWRLLLAWLGPMLALAGTALYITVRWGSVPGIAAALGAWAAVVSVGWWRALHEAAGPEMALWLLERISGSNLLAVFYLALLVGGLYLLKAAGSWMTRSDPAWS